MSHKRKLSPGLWRLNNLIALNIERMFDESCVAYAPHSSLQSASHLKLPNPGRKLPQMTTEATLSWGGPSKRANGHCSDIPSAFLSHANVYAETSVVWRSLLSRRDLVWDRIPG